MRLICFGSVVIVGVAVLLGCSQLALADWDGPTKWIQGPRDPVAALSTYHWIQTEKYDVIVADDWRCTDPGDIAEISFQGWDQLYPDDPRTNFRLRIWSDVPAMPGYDESHPAGDAYGGWLWEKYITKADPYDPHKIGWQYFGNFNWKINLAQSDWFHQEGTQEQPRIYWISIQGSSGLTFFYWYFRERHTQTNLDDAAMLTRNAFQGHEANVWYNAGSQYTGNPYPNDLADPTYFRDALPAGWKSVDMCFSLTEGIIPEPSSLMALGAGLFGLLGLATRRRK